MVIPYFENSLQVGSGSQLKIGKFFLEFAFFY